MRMLSKIAAFMLTVLMFIYVIPFSMFASEQVPEERGTVEFDPETAESTKDESAAQERDFAYDAVDTSKTEENGNEFLPDGLLSKNELAAADNPIPANTVGSATSTSGYYTYSVSNGQATITDCSTSIRGAVVIPSEIDGYPVTGIGVSAFSFCTLMTSITIPDSVISIGNSAFRYCWELAGITIGNNVTSIGDHAFSDCDEISSIKVGSGNTVYHSAGNCIIDTAKRELVLGCKTSIIPSDGSVTSIGENAFYDCNGLSSIIIPDCITSIGESAFEDSGLWSITIPDSVITIGDYAFYECLGLSSLTIGNGVESIGAYAFYYCTSLTSITIPDNVTDISYGMFYNCWGLTSITLGNGVESIGAYAFYYCTSLTSITIPDSVTSIGQSAFQYCTSLSSVTIGNSVVSIGNSAFCFCYALSNITIPDSVKSIGVNAFVEADLTSVTVGNGVTSIGDGAFEYCYRLVEVINHSSLDLTLKSRSYGYIARYALEIHTGETKLEDTGEYLFYPYNGIYYLIGYTGSDTDIVLPESFNGNNYAINYNAFRETGVRNVTIPDSVTSIGDGAFEDCWALTDITIGNNVTNIGGETFYGCYSLTSITIPDSVEIIGDDAFGECTGLTRVNISDLSAWCRISFYNYNNPLYYAKHLYLDDVEIKDLVIPDDITVIKGWSFLGCSGLTSLTIPDNVTCIYYEAFWGCSGLTSITIPDSVTRIDYGAFSSCTGLTSVTLGNGIKYIDEEMFYKCNNLKSIIIPDGITGIGYDAFYRCSSLTSIRVPESVTRIEEYVFDGCYDLTMYVHSGSYAETYAEENDIRYVILETHTHSYKSNIIAPTCTEQGYTIYTCKCCDSYKKSYTSALGHNFSEWAEITPATETTTGLKRRICSRCSVCEEKTIPATGVYTTNYVLEIKNASNITAIRIASGNLTTSSEIKNAPDRIDISAAVIARNTDAGGSFIYELPDGGIWSVWYKTNDGEQIIVSGLDNTVMTQTVDVYGVTMTVNNLYGVKDFFVAKGHYTTYREVKNADGCFSVTSTKIAGAHSYKYGAAVGDPGEYTICIRYDDGRPDCIQYFTCEVEYPTVDVFGKNITFGNIDDIRVIRVAAGKYSTLNEVKNADGVRNFTAGTIAKLGFTDSLTVNNAANEDGSDNYYTVTIEYRNFYTEIHNITINKLMPNYTVNGNSITFTGLEGLDIIRCAPGTFTTPTEIKNAAGSRYVKGTNVTGDTVTFDSLSGVYTFLVQYTENSRTIFTLDF